VHMKVLLYCIKIQWLQLKRFLKVYMIEYTCEYVAFSLLFQVRAYVCCWLHGRWEPL
jgi:hypothetical protein